jgi:iron complex transport system ATP-binding protein
VIPAVELAGVAFGYRRTPVFRALDLAFADGEMAAVAGPNGSGKSTLLRLVGGALRPGAGDVRLYGRTVASLPPRERARTVAVVPQESWPAFDFTVEEMVGLGRTPHVGLLGALGPADRAGIAAAMESADVSHLRERAFRALSGGERQRVLIARALAQEARVVLLDEPTAFLDLKHGLEAYAVLGRLHRERGLTVVVVTHDLNLAARHCPRLVVLRCGEIAADGAPDAVLTPALLRDVYQVEADVRRDPDGGAPLVVPRRPHVP